MFRKAFLALLLTAESTAFVTSPFGGVHKISVVPSRQVLYSETEAPEVGSIVEGDEEPIVEEVSASVDDDSGDDNEAEGEEEKKTRGPYRSVRYTAFVGNLPFTTEVNEVRELFSAHGEVVFVSMPRHKESGQARGFAFVDMSTKEEVDAAIAKLNGVEVGGRMIRVVESLPKDEAQKRPKKFDEGVKKIYVGNLSFDTTVEDLREFFGSYGKVTDVYLPMDKDNSPRGFAFISMREEDIDSALEATNEQEFMGRVLKVSLPLPPGEKAPRRTDRTKIYVGNLSFYTAADTVAELFEEFGTVHDCYLPEDNVTGSSRGFGFVTMDKEAAETAIAETDGCELDGRIITVNEANPRGQRREVEEDQVEDDQYELD